MKALVISNINMAPITSVFREMQAEVSGYDDYMLQLLDPGSSAHEDEFDVVISHLDGDVFFSGQRDPQEYRSAVGGFCERNPRKLVLINTFCLKSETPITYSNLWSGTEPTLVLEGRANELFVELARSHENVLLLDMGLLYRRFGYDSLTSAAFWYLGRIKYTHLMMRELARHIEQLLTGYLNRSRKVLVLDLDDTLWGGVIGEEGASGVELSEDGRGKIYRDFQGLVKALHSSGVLLAINSKNNLSEVEEVFRTHPMMVLSLEDFSAIEVNWNEKDQNMRRIAERLGVGLESMVFIDDSPTERAWVESQIEEIVVPAFPVKIEDLPTWFLRDVAYRYFPRYRLTAEDRARPAQYAARRQRDEASQGLSRHEFLKSLDVKLNFELDPALSIERASQLTQKTNQFNVTTKRYSVPEIRTLVESPSYRVILVDYEDRFGKEGTIGLVIVDLEKGEIDSLLMSCRVIGRDIENHLLRQAEAALRRSGRRMVSGSFIPTKRNAPASELFQKNGYRLVSEDRDGKKYFQKELDG
jgi:FkbH-like protein